MEEKDSKFTFLFMKQVPKDTAESFVALANEQFAGHFGFALKALLDSNLAFKNEIDASRFDEIEKRLSKLEEKKEEEIAPKRVGGSLK